MNKSISTYTKGILAFNLLALTFISFYVWKGWSYRVHPSVNLVFFKEMFITFSTVPIYFIWMNELNKSKINSRKFKKGFFVFVMLLIVTMYGSGMHNSANQIRSLIDGPIVYFYDEILSHYIFLTALLSLGFCIALLQFNSPYKQRSSNYEKTITFSSGIFQGLIIATGALEANYGIWALIFSSIFFVVLILKTLNTSANKFPLSWYYLFHFGTIAILLIIYIVINKSFTNPLVFGIEDLK